MNTQTSTAEEVSYQLMELEARIRQAISNGTILDFMIRKKDDIVNTFVHAKSPDADIQTIFERHPFVATFIVSWRQFKEQPGFVRFWQKEVANQSMAMATSTLQGAAANVPLPESSVQPLAGHQTAASAASNEPLAKVVEKRKGRGKAKTRGAAKPTAPPRTAPPRTAPPPVSPQTAREQSTASSTAPPQPGPTPSAPSKALLATPPPATPPPALEESGPALAAASNPAPPQPAPEKPIPSSPVPGTSTARPIRIGRVTLLDPVDPDASSAESDDDFFLAPAIRSTRRGKQRAKADVEVDVNMNRENIQSDIEMGTATDADSTKPKASERRKPERHSEVHDPPCARCSARGVTCWKEIGGGACYACARGKYRCNYSGVKGQRFSKKDTRSKPARKTKKSAPIVESDREVAPVEFEHGRTLPRLEKALKELRKPPPAHPDEVRRAAAAAATIQYNEFQEQCTGNLDLLQDYFNHELDVHAERFRQEEAKVTKLEESIHRLTDHLEAILQRTASRMTAQEANAASRIEQLEKKIEALVNQVHEVSSYLGLPDVLEPLHGHPPLGREPGDTQSVWLGTPRPAASLEGYLHWQTSVEQPAAPEGETSGQELKAITAVPEGELSGQEAAAPMGGQDLAAADPAAAAPRAGQEMPATHTNAAPETPATSTTSAPEADPTAASVPKATTTTVESALAGLTLTTASAVALSAASTITPNAGEPASTATTAPTPAGHPEPATTAPTPAGHPEHPAPGTTAAAPATGMDIDQLAPAEPAAVSGIPAHPRIQRVPATPQNSQDTQATHVTILGSQSTQPRSRTGSIALVPGLAQEPALAVPACPRTRSQSRGAPDDNSTASGQKRKASDGDEGGRTTRRPKV